MWRTIKLGDFITVQNGYAFNSKLFDADGDIGLIRIRDLKEGTSTETRYTGEFDSKFVVKSGDLLIGMDGEFRCYEWKGEDALLNQRVCRLQDFNKDLDKRFLLYAINDELKKIEDVTGFTTVKHLSSKNIKEIQLLLPPIAEQQRIVEKLDAAFAEIDRAVEATNEQRKNSSLIALAWLRGKFAQDKLDSKTLSLFDGMPTAKPKDGWKWHKLTDIAKLESGHTPSRRHPEYWGGEIKWVGIKDARKHHAGVIFDTEQKTNELGIKNSSARLLPKDTVCLSRTASVGYVFRLGEPMATSQDFINWVCTPSLQPEFLQLLFLAEDEAIKRFGSGAIHKTIYFDTAKEFHVCIPSLERQSEIIGAYTPIIENSKTVIKSTEEKITALTSLKSAILAQELQPSEAA